MNHMRSLFTLSLLIVSLCYAMTCSSQKDKTEVTEQGTTAGQEIASVVSPTNADLDKSQNWNEIAKLLAGVEGPKSDSPAVNRHRALMKDFWVRIQKENMEPIAAWREKNLPESAKSRNVLYPLSGADFLNAYAFFPGASDYILIALEPWKRASSGKDDRSTERIRTCICAKSNLDSGTKQLSAKQNHAR